VRSVRPSAWSLLWCHSKPPAFRGRTAWRHFARRRRNSGQEITWPGSRTGVSRPACPSCESDRVGAVVGERISSRSLRTGEPPGRVRSVLNSEGAGFEGPVGNRKARKTSLDCLLLLQKVKKMSRAAGEEGYRASSSLKASRIGRHLRRGPRGAPQVLPTQQVSFQASFLFSLFRDDDLQESSPAQPRTFCTKLLLPHVFLEGA